MSRFVQDLLERLFSPEPAPLTGAQSPAVLHRELLKRPSTYLTSLAQWTTDRLPQVTAFLQAQMERSQSGEASDVVSVYAFTASAGLTIDPGFLEPSEAHFLFDALKERIQATGYRVQQADRTYFDHGRAVEERLRYYLKPDVNPTIEGLQDQGYGNITLELCVNDHVPRIIRLQASHYQDGRFSRPLPFETLAVKLLESN